eukprot:TRINITY_DN1570_c0_g1_i6.p1 TRINITY_DN1570_c0_g1~~TRINITY_DN1570_c0_g1_i6.p1  ORF type:complete len:413 (+),score=97.50 TRINITY_DN1570_c0_g1_i6:49-1287(+)
MHLVPLSGMPAAVVQCPPSSPAPAAAPHVHVQNPSRKTCRLWVQTGECCYGNACKFVHGAKPKRERAAPLDAAALGEELLSLAVLLRPSSCERALSGLPRAVVEKEVQRQCRDASVHLVGSRAFGGALPHCGADVLVEGWSGSTDRLCRDLKKVGFTTQRRSDNTLLLWCYTAAESAARPTTIVLSATSPSPHRSLCDTLRQRLDANGGTARAVLLALRLLLQQRGVDGLSGTAAAVMVATVEAASSPPPGGERPRAERAGLLFRHVLQQFAAWRWAESSVLLGGYRTAKVHDGPCSVGSPFDASLNLAAGFKDVDGLVQSLRRACAGLSGGLWAVLADDAMVSSRREMRRRASAAAESEKEKLFALMDEQEQVLRADAGAVVATAPQTGWAADDQPVSDQPYSPGLCAVTF